MNESLEKSIHDLQFLVSDLRDCLKKANAVEGLIVLPIIERAVVLLRDAQALQGARDADPEFLAPVNLAEYERSTRKG